MEEITEGMVNMDVYDTHKKNRIQVSNTKKPLFFYVNLAKRYMQQHEEVELSALGMAIATVVTVAEILKNNGLAIEKKILTSTVDMKDETRGRPIQKAKVEIILEKSEQFDELMAAAAEERELAPEDDQFAPEPLNPESKKAENMLVYSTGNRDTPTNVCTIGFNDTVVTVCTIAYCRTAKTQRSPADSDIVETGFTTDDSSDAAESGCNVDSYDSETGYSIDGLDTETGWGINSSDTAEIPTAMPILHHVEEPGILGLKNQGATCYWNSLLQSLYHIPYFRKAVYRMPFTGDPGAVYFALQELFFDMQYSPTCPTTAGLTMSLGWHPHEALVEKDINEHMMMLLEKLHEAMKGTAVEGTITNLFEGHYQTYIECTNVKYQSSINSTFRDLQLDVKDCKNVYESFDKYVEIEELKGENKYRADNYGLQDAKRRVLFTKFPPVLQLHLKRFGYDSLGCSKINTRYEFPLQLDMDRDRGKYLIPDADRSVRNLFCLHSVLVHRGDATSGHYYAFIRPTLTGAWYRIDDEYVTMVPAESAVEEQYGGEVENPPENPECNPIQAMKNSSAYTLVYVRDSDKKEIMCPVYEKDYAEHLQTWRKDSQIEILKAKGRKDDIYTSDNYLPQIAPDAYPSNQHGETLDLVDNASSKERPEEFILFNGISVPGPEIIRMSNEEQWAVEDYQDHLLEESPDLVHQLVYLPVDIDSNPSIQSPVTPEVAEAIALELIIWDSAAKRRKDEEERRKEKGREEVEIGENEASRTGELLKWQSIVAVTKAFKEEEACAWLEEDKPIISDWMKEQMRECLLCLRQVHKDEAARVESAFLTILTYINNAAQQPDVEYYRKIRFTDVTFQEKLGSLRGGVEFLQLCGYEKDGGEYLILPRNKVNFILLNTACSQVVDALNNPFFGSS